MLELIKEPLQEKQMKDSSIHVKLDPDTKEKLEALKGNNYSSSAILRASITLMYNLKKVGQIL